MAHLVAAIVAVARAHALLAYGLAFLLTGLEAFPVAGALVPETATIVAFGALVPSGALLFWPLLLTTAAGAIAGDGFSYWIGHHYKARAATIWPLRRHPNLVLRGEAFFARHGGKAIVVARFTPGVRAVVPLVAGIIGMTPVRFYAMNVLSALAWAPLHVVMGVAIGASLTILGAVAGRLAAVVVVFFGALALIVWLTPRLARALIRHGLRLAAPLRSWAARGTTWPRRQVGALLDPDRPELHVLVVLGASLVTGLWLLVGVLQDLIADDPLLRADHAIFHLLRAVRVQWIDGLAVAAMELSDLRVTLAVAVATALWLAWRGTWRAAAYAAAAVGGAFAFGAVLDLLRHGAAGPVAMSGPGGEIAASVALYAFLALLIARGVGGAWIIVIATVATAALAVFVLARLYLGADWLSTALAGAAFAVAWVALLGFAYVVRTPLPVRSPGLLAVATLSLLAAGSIAIAEAHAADVRHFAIRLPVQRMTLAGWEQGGWATLPRRRLDLLGEHEEPFVLQWAATLGSLEAQLEAGGWSRAAPWTFRSVLQFLSPKAHATSLPVLPHLENGRAERLVMVEAGGTVPSRSADRAASLAVRRRHRLFRNHQPSVVDRHRRRREDRSPGRTVHDRR